MYPGEQNGIADEMLRSSCMQDPLDGSRLDFRARLASIDDPGEALKASQKEGILIR